MCFSLCMTSAILALASLHPPYRPDIDDITADLPVLHCSKWFSSCGAALQQLDMNAENKYLNSLTVRRCRSVLVAVLQVFFLSNDYYEVLGQYYLRVVVQQDVCTCEHPAATLGQGPEVRWHVQASQVQTPVRNCSTRYTLVHAVCT